MDWKHAFHSQMNFYLHNWSNILSCHMPGLGESPHLQRKKEIKLIKQDLWIRKFTHTCTLKLKIYSYFACTGGFISLHFYTTSWMKVRDILEWNIDEGQLVNEISLNLPHNLVLYRYALQILHYEDLWLP